MQVLVIGGAGYIGSHTVQELVRAGHRVRILDNLSTGRRFLAQGHDLEVGDVRDPQVLQRSMRGIEAVFHFAAHAYVGESVSNPRKYFDNNVRAGLHLLDVVLDAGVQCFVFSSSCAVYGKPQRVPITEDQPRQPVNPYGVSKLFFEQALEAYSTAYGLRSVSLRYFNAAGADEEGRLGECHDPETHLIPCILRAAAGLQSQLEIYGNDYPTADGTCVRDYIHVNDLAAAHSRALDYLAAGGPTTAFNLGTGRGHSIREVIAVVERLTGQTVPHLWCPRRAGDPPVLTADASRALQVLHWQPRRSLDEMVATAWNWMQRSRQPAYRRAAPAD